MFGKRRRAASSPAQRAPLSSASASASLAASKAFIKNAESNGDVSSAAAAAALRTHTTTPTPVGETVTKRMARRGSLSSNGSSSRQPPGSLHRQSSSGSMTERSFRSPSPGRGSPPDSNAPPVPPVPADIQHHANVQRRASSVEPVYRGASPGPRGGGRGVSLDRGASTSRRGVQRSTNPLAHVSEEEDTARSINFSRPMSPGAVGIKQSPSSPTTSGWFGGPVVNQDALQRMASSSRPKTSSGVPSHHLKDTQRSIQNAAERPVSTKRIAQGVEGSRLSSGSMHVKPSGTAVQIQTYSPRQSPRPVDPNSPDAVYDPSTRTFIHKQDAMARHREMHEIPEPVHQQEPQRTETFHSVPIPEKQRGRGSPSPIRHYIRQEQSVPQRKAEPRTIVQRNPDDFADAHVEAPEQANTSPTLEDSGYGTIVGHDDNTASPVLAQNQDSAYPKLATPASSRPVSTRNSYDHERTGRDRSSPLTPPRTAHFAPVATELTGLKHEPLPRSVSPAKSALKASPSVSRRGESPLRSNGLLHTKGASSEASDTASDDGGRRKKKNVRVSFEEDVVVGGAYAPSHPEPPAYGGLGASKWSPIAEKDDEFEDLKKPRPALPSFGSIREKERRPREDVPEKVTEIISTSPVGDRSRVSSEVELGNIVSDDRAQKQGASENPLPPEVTTVEGSGYSTDSSDHSVHQEGIAQKEISQEPPAPEPKSLSVPQEEVAPAMITLATEQRVHVPDIAFQPATPSPYEKPAPEFPSIAIPGGWDEDATGARDQVPKPVVSTSTPSTHDPEPSSQPQQSSPPEGEETTDDESSVYSDAYEDLSDGGGFASIDALMQKPVDPSPSGLMQSKYAAQDATDEYASTPRPDTYAYESEDSEATQTQDWNVTQSHWSSVRASLILPQDIEISPEDPKPQEAPDRVMQAPVVQDRSIPAASSSPPPKPLKSALKKSPAPQTTRPAGPQNTTTRAPAPPENRSEIRMRKTMRGGTDGDEPRTGSTMRSSMRTGSENTPRAQPQMRQSMRSGSTPPKPAAGLAASRHSTIVVDTKPPRGALQKKNIPPSAATPKPRPQSMPAAKSKATPVPTYDSDSDASASSFRRARNRGSRQQGGRYTMRASMRQESTPTLRSSAPGPKQVGAIPPPVAPSPAMRKSMRPSSPTPETVKSSKFSIRSLSPMGRFRRGSDVRPYSPTEEKPMPSFVKQSEPVKPKPQAAKVPFKSRFADSSDEEEEERPRRFQSRFEDSDDEPADFELPPGLTPVRGIPRRPGEEDGDSTDLEEEAEEEMPADVSKPAPQANGTNGNAHGPSAALTAGSLRDSKHATLPTFESGKGKKKRGFFGLGKKKTSQAESVSAPGSKLSDIPMPPAQRNRDKNAPMTPIDENKEFGDSVPASSKRPPKLQRRATPDWPLPPPPAIGTENRPLSSDGVAPRRPRFASRQPSAVSNVTEPAVDTQGHSTTYGRSGKKKKFQGLRRVFGLND